MNLAKTTVLSIFYLWLNFDGIQGKTGFLPTKNLSFCGKSAILADFALDNLNFLILNDTHFAIDGSYSYVIDVVAPVQAVFVIKPLFKRIGVPEIIQITVPDVCHAQDPMGYSKGVTKFLNYTSCPIRKGSTEIFNMAIFELAQAAPRRYVGKYSSEFTFINGDGAMVCFKIVGELFEM